MANNAQETRAPILSGCLQEIERGGHVLRQALLAHDADAIWNAIALQEESLARLRNCCSREISPSEDEPAPSANQNIVTRELVARTRSVLRTNRALARAFLDIVDKTLSRLALGGTAGSSVYNQSGRMGSLSAPLLIQQRG